MIQMKKYENHSINKLQKSVIQLVFQMLKIRNISFVGNLTPSSSCEFYDNDVIVMSFTWCFIKKNPFCFFS